MRYECSCNYHDMTREQVLHDLMTHNYSPYGDHVITVGGSIPIRIVHFHGRTFSMPFEGAVIESTNPEIILRAAERLVEISELEGRISALEEEIEDLRYELTAPL